MRHLLPFAFLVPCLLAQDAAPRSARAILRDFDRVAMPSFSSGNDPESLRKFDAAIREGSRKKAELALELFAAHPDHERVPEVMETRWASLGNVLHDHAAVVVETTMLLEDEDAAPELRHMALRARTHAIVQSELSTNRERLAAVREFLAAHPDDMYVGMALLDTVQNHLADPAVMRPLLELGAERWADSPYVGPRCKPWLRLLDLIGKPFTEQLPAATRAPFAAATGAKAPFTVVQLWSGWVVTPGNRKEIEALGALRAEFGDAVRVIGLLNGDLAERLPAAEQAGVAWPQLPIEGPKPHGSPLGVGRMPCYFVLDADLTIVGVVGSAQAAALRLRQLAG